MPQVARTSQRPLASGALTTRQALVFLGGQLTIGLFVLLSLNTYRYLCDGSANDPLAILFVSQHRPGCVLAELGRAISTDEARFRLATACTWLGIQLGCVVSLPVPLKNLLIPVLFAGALLGWSAVHSSLLPAVVAPLYASGVCWTLVYDTLYAHQVRTEREARIRTLRGESCLSLISRGLLCAPIFSETCMKCIQAGVLVVYHAGNVVHSPLRIGQEG